VEYVQEAGRHRLIRVSLSIMSWSWRNKLTLRRNHGKPTQSQINSSGPPGSGHQVSNGALRGRSF